MNAIVHYHFNQLPPPPTTTNNKTPTAEEIYEKVKNIVNMKVYSPSGYRQPLSEKDLQILINFPEIAQLIEYLTAENKRKDEALERISTYSSQPRSFDQAMHVIAHLRTKATTALIPSPFPNK